jgi:AraC-type DNA-binding domain-containing proteins
MSILFYNASYMDCASAIANLDLLNGACGVPIRLYGASRCLWRCISSESLGIDEAYDRSLLREYEDARSAGPLLCVSEFGEMWTVLSCSTDGDPISAILGPVAEMTISEEALREIVNSTEHQRLGAFLKIREKIPYVPLTRFTSIVALAQFVLTQERLDARDFRVVSRSKLEGDGRDEGAAAVSASRRDARLSQNTARFERAMLDCVRRGEVARVAQLLVSAVGQIGVVSSNPLRQEKDMFIICTAIVSRAAMAGGLEAGAAYALGNSYIDACEKMKSIHSVKDSYRKMILDFTGRVARCRSRPELSPLMRRVADYLDQHLDARLDTTELAERFGYSRSYLSSRFSAELGLSITAYANAQRIECAKELLREGDEAIADVAAMVGFSTSSRFIALFKKCTGLTPLQYRNSP